MLERQPEGTNVDNPLATSPTTSKSTNVSRIKVACVQCAASQTLVRLKIRQKAMGGSVNEAIEREET